MSLAWVPIAKRMNFINLGVFSLVERIRQPLGRRPGWFLPYGAGLMMIDKNRLTTVPDTSMLTLFKGLVTFLTEEAQQRGWEDVTARLKSVESALTDRKN